MVLFDRIFKVRLARSLRNKVGLACFDPGLIAGVIGFHGVVEWTECQPSALGFGSGVRVWQVAFPLPLARELTITADMPQCTARVISRYIQFYGLGR